MKTAIRHQMREKRKALSQALHAEKSEKICKYLEALPVFKEAKKILIYVSLDEEVDTHRIIQEALKKGRALYVPKIEGGQIAIYALQNWKELKHSTFGILEPTSKNLEPADPKSMDLIIIPGLAFDSRGHRIGYGKGHYDRLLKKSNAYKVGLAFSEQVIDKVPDEDHDIPLDLIITDTL